MKPSPTYDIDAIKAQLRVADLLATFNVPPPHSGVINCPLPTHSQRAESERTPSFSIYDNERRWKCWGDCDANGDVIDLAERLGNLAQGDAIAYCANLAGVANTGHGRRTGGVSNTNLQIGLGDRTAKELISQIDDGVYLELGGLSPDLVSGDVTTSLDFAFWIENGELTYPLANTMVGGNLIEMLGSIEAISSDVRHEPGNDMPTIVIRDVQISSGGV